MLTLEFCEGECLGVLTGLSLALSRGVFPYLEQLKIAHTTTREIGLSMLFQALKIHHKKLKVIGIQRFTLSFDDMRVLVDLASSPGVALETLLLSSAGLTDEAVGILAAALGKKGAFSQPTELDLSHNSKITDKGGMHLVEAISAGHLARMERLSLSYATWERK